MTPSPDFSDLFGGGRLTSSFTDFLRTERPELLPQPMTGPSTFETIEATTIVAVRFADGVVMAGDRRATEGFSIAHRAMEKVFPADGFSAIGIAGAAGPAVEMVRLFQVELEYYEKVEGEALSLAGKANRLGSLIRGNLPAAMQGFVVLPLFGGYDQRTGVGRIYRYDVTGGLSEETDYHAVGSGGRDAKNSLKKLYGRAEDLPAARAVEIVIEALTDAAEEDAGTAGPDPVHGIYPTVFLIDQGGVRPIPDADIERDARAILEARTQTESTR
jgi:proteasome beta subunit